MTPETNEPQRPRRFGVVPLPRYSAVNLLGALALLFVSAPFVEDLPRGDLIEAFLFTLVMVFAVVVVGGRRRTLVVTLLLFIPALVGKWADRLNPDLVSPLVFLIPKMAFFGLVVANLLRFILQAPRVDINILCAGLAGYLLLGLLWMPAYVAVARLAPPDHPAFALSAGWDASATMDSFHAFYFSFITLCTVGYGDVTPVSRVARMLAVTEAITGLFYVTVLISRLVAVYSSTRTTAHTNTTDKL
jgi:hypothetical protein